MALRLFAIGVDLLIVGYAFAHQQFAFACIFSGFIGALLIAVVVDAMEAR